MGSLVWTNRLLLLIATALLGHLVLALADRPLIAETFRLDSCITDTPADKPVGYEHVVSHGMVND